MRTVLPAEVDVVVVGGGLAGLSCARGLQRSGLSVAVLEARDRVGGRTLSQPLGEGVFDLGGQWLGAKQPRVERLARELGIGLFPTYTTGKKVLDLAGKRSTYRGTIPTLAPWKLLELQRALMTVNRASRAIPLDDPSRAAEARALDGISLQEWQESRVHSRTARALIAAAVRVIFGAEPREISALHFLFYARSGTGIESLIEIKNGAQEQRFVEGAQELSIRLAARLGEAVHLGTPVRAIEQEAAGVVVRAGEGAVRARRGGGAPPPGLASRLAYSPALPASRDQLWQRYPMGATVKCLALYPSAFWREKGLSGEAVCTEGPVSVIFDNTSHDGRQASLLAFVVGDPARIWSTRPELERRDAVLAVMARCFGPAAAAPTHYLEQDWSTEPYSRGCPVGVLSPGALSVGAAPLREPSGKIHWAGTETATEWNGYMEGALQSGERASAEVIAALVSAGPAASTSSARGAA